MCISTPSWECTTATTLLATSAQCPPATTTYAPTAWSFVSSEPIGASSSSTFLHHDRHGGHRVGDAVRLLPGRLLLRDVQEDLGRHQLRAVCIG